VTEPSLLTEPVTSLSRQTLRARAEESVSFIEGTDRGQVSLLRQEANLQAETLCCIGGVARPCGVDRRSRADVSPHVRTPHCLDGVDVARAASGSMKSRAKMVVVMQRI
jgi:hypothetical protein